MVSTPMMTERIFAAAPPAMGEENTSTIRDRIQGVQAALQERKILYDPALNITGIRSHLGKDMSADEQWEAAKRMIKDFMEEHPDILQAFTNALQKGMDYVNTHTPKVSEEQMIWKSVFLTDRKGAIIRNRIMPELFRTKSLWEKMQFYVC